MKTKNPHKRQLIDDSFVPFVPVDAAVQDPKSISANGTSQSGRFSAGLASSCINNFQAKNVHLDAIPINGHQHNPG